MSLEQAEWAVQSLYENPGVRDELTDAEAQTLLKWGEAQIQRLAAMGMDDAEFEEAFDRLSGLIKRMNRLAARQAYLQPEDQALAMNRIAESAAAIGLPISAQALNAFLHQPTSQSAPNIHANVQALIALVNPETDTDIDDTNRDSYDEEV